MRTVLLIILWSWPFTSYSSESNELTPFVTNGCSAPGIFDPDAYSDCCVQHDFSYWIGGTLQMKQRADAALINCIRGKNATPFTIGVWQAALAAFGRQNWGSYWIPKKDFAPLSKSDWKQVIQKAGVAYQSNIPIVKSYRSQSACTDNLKTLLSNATTLNDLDLSCYELFNTTSEESRFFTLVYSSECEVGYFVYSFQRTDENSVIDESIAGYGLCADKIKPKMRASRPEPAPQYKVVPPLNATK